MSDAVLCQVPMWLVVRPSLFAVSLMALDVRLLALPRVPVGVVSDMP